MATTVSWSVSNESVEIGEYLELTAEGLDSFETMAVLIQLPNASHFMWGVQADSNGRVRDKIKLDSGAGQYLICPKPACGYVVPRCKHINVCPCAESSTNCAINVEGPDQIIKGTTITYVVSGLRPSKAITAKVANNTQTSYSLERTSDESGVLHFEFIHNLAGTYAITFSDGVCTSAPKIIEVVNSQNEIPQLRAQNRTVCASAVDIFIAFSKAKYSPNELGYLKASVCNRGPEFREVALSPFFSLPGATITSMPIPEVVGLSGYRCEEYTILFSAGPAADASYFASLPGSYECQTRIFTANGATTHAIVGVGKGVCSGTLQYFGTVSGGNSYVAGEEIELSVQVFNSGNKVIEYGAVNALTLPEGVSLVTTLPIATNPITPGTSQSLRIKIKATEKGDYTIQLPADKIVVKCGEGEIPLNSVGYISFTAT